MAARYYINGKYQGGETETYDEFHTRREARRMLAEYAMSYGPGFDLWISTRSTKAWREG